MSLKTLTSNILLEGGGGQLGEEKKEDDSINKIHVFPVTPCWAKADPLLCEYYLSEKQLQRIYKHSLF